MKDRRKHKHTSSYDTILLSECIEEHEKCPITYYRGRIKELCMCRCHPHARPSTRDNGPEPIIGIAGLKGIEALKGIH
jgi:hypothetical protein